MTRDLSDAAKQALAEAGKPPETGTVEVGKAATTWEMTNGLRWKSAFIGFERTSGSHPYSADP